ncbi:MAG: 50S ribosomal protein L21 [Nitrospinota bacterium]|nr:50S ribosomal protein L21 [Nitrospinota bacterium]
MFAVIRTGGKQYRVSETDHVEIDLLKGKEGDTVEFNDVIIGSDSKTVTVGGKVQGKILSHVMGAKIYIQKHRRRKHSRKKTGHRQKHTVVEITSIKTA